MPENRNPSQMVKALIAASVVKTQQCEPSQNEPSWPPSRWQCVCDIMCKWALNLNQVPRAVWRLLAAVLTTNVHRGIEAVKWSETMAVTGPGRSSCAVNIQITPTLWSPGPCKACFRRAGRARRNLAGFTQPTKALPCKSNHWDLLPVWILGSVFICIGEVGQWSSGSSLAVGDSQRCCVQDRQPKLFLEAPFPGKRAASEPLGAMTSTRLVPGGKTMPLPPSVNPHRRPHDRL